MCSIYSYPAVDGKVYEKSILIVLHININNCFILADHLLEHLHILLFLSVHLPARTPPPLFKPGVRRVIRRAPPFTSPCREVLPQWRSLELGPQTEQQLRRRFRALTTAAGGAGGTG